MGICFFLCIPRKNRVLWVVKRDGKMIKFRGPILVKEVLVNFSGWGVGESREALQHLPSDYELKNGRVYYLLPSSPGSSVSDSEVSSMADDGEKKISGMKRIKVVITKQQLQELLSKKISLEELLLSQSDCSLSSSPRNWKPKLDPIPEGIE